MAVEQESVTLQTHSISGQALLFPASLPYRNQHCLCVKYEACL